MDARSLIGVIAASMVILEAALVRVDASAFPGSVHVWVAADGVTVVAVDARLDTIVATVAERTGVLATVDESVAAERRSLDLRAMPVDVVFRALAGPHDAFATVLGRIVTVEVLKP